MASGAFDVAFSKGKTENGMEFDARQRFRIVYRKKVFGWREHTDICLTDRKLETLLIQLSWRQSHMV